MVAMTEEPVVLDLIKPSSDGVTILGYIRAIRSEMGRNSKRAGRLVNVVRFEPSFDLVHVRQHFLRWCVRESANQNAGFDLPP